MTGRRKARDNPFAERAEAQRQAHFERERARTAEVAAARRLREASESLRSHTATAAFYRNLAADEPDVLARSAHRRNAELFEFRAAQAADELARLSASQERREKQDA